MKDLPKRILTGLLFGVVVIGSVLGGPFTFSALVAAIAVFGLIEFYKICKLNGSSLNVAWLVLMGIAGLLFILANFNGFVPNKILASIMVLPFVVMITELYRNKSNPVGNITAAISGWVYIIVPLVLWSWSAFSINTQLPNSFQKEFILGYLVIIWCSDTGAYFAGVSFGKTRLFERISPKKSWEGLFGGLVLAVIAAVVIDKFDNVLQLIDWIVISIIILVTGTMGDLVESMLKRSVNIKDSGNILPGHGGVLDRFDSLFISAPFVFLYLLISGAIL